jgi:hypothetical protein
MADVAVTQADILAGPVALLNGNRYILPMPTIGEDESPPAIAVLGFDLNGGTLTCALEARVAGAWPGPLEAPFMTGVQALYLLDAIATPVASFTASKVTRVNCQGVQIAITVTVQTGAPRVFVRFLP